MGKQNWRKLSKSSELIRQVKLLIIHKSSVSILFYSNGCKVTVFKAISLHYDLYKKKTQSRSKGSSQSCSRCISLSIFMACCFQIQCYIKIPHCFYEFLFLDSVLRFAGEWNTNSRHCHEAQFVLNTVFKTYPPEEILKFPNIKSTMEAFIPYTGTISSCKLPCVIL